VTAARVLQFPTLQVRHAVPHGEEHPVVLTHREHFVQC
jgi:hypothetical protein